MNCPNCHKTLPDDAFFCSWCGRQTSRQRLSSVVVTIGRRQDNDIVINNDFVSGLHVKVTVEDGFCLLEDQNSRNGTFINGYRTQIQRIKPTDRILLSQQAQISYAEIMQAAIDKGYYDIHEMKTGLACPTPGAEARPDWQPSPVPEPAPALQTPPLPPQYQPPAPVWQEQIGVGQWIGYLLLCLLPVVGIILCIVWSRDNRSPSRANWAAVYLWFVIAGLALGLVYGILFSGSFFQAIM